MKLKGQLTPKSKIDIFRLTCGNPYLDRFGVNG